MKNNYYTHNERFSLPDIREGACSKDVWRIYNMLPMNSYVTISFIATIFFEGTSTELEKFGFTKDGSANIDMTTSEYEHRLQEAFRRWGYKGYRSLELIWNRGFGNSVQINIIVDACSLKQGRDA